MSNYRAAAASSEQRQPQDKKVKSWMWEHVRDYHDGVVGENGGIGDFKLKVTGSLQNAFRDKWTRTLGCKSMKLMEAFY